MDIEVVEATLAEKAVVRRLVELYMHDFSEFNGRDVDSHGLYGYRYLDHYWTEPDRHPFLIRVNGKWAGFALVRTGDENAMAEFFVMRKYRRSGVGRHAARSLIARFPGRWRIEQLRENPQAREFWRVAITQPFEEVDTDDGWAQLFDV